MADHGKTSSWFVVGLSVGALAAILYAPKSGRETRRAISQGVNDGVKHLTALGRDARERNQCHLRKSRGACLSHGKRVLLPKNQCHL